LSLGAVSAARDSAVRNYFEDVAILLVVLFISIAANFVGFSIQPPRLTSSGIGPRPRLGTALASPTCARRIPHAYADTVR
jgi:hypothetical protein